MIFVIFENPSKKGNTMARIKPVNVDIKPDGLCDHIIRVSVPEELQCTFSERLVRIKKLPTLIITADDVEQIDDILAALTRAEENREIDFPFESRAV